jgi:Holliday junction resolvase RusA-like endonuclease
MLMNAKQIQFIVLGKPKPKQRVRIYHRRGVNTHSNARYEQDVLTPAAIAWRDWCKTFNHSKDELLHCALDVHIEFRIPVPESWPPEKKAAAQAGFVYPTTKPDLDNLRKAVNDAINGEVWLDDSYIVNESHSKRYAEQTCAIVTINMLDGATAQQFNVDFSSDSVDTILADIGAAENDIFHS